VTPLQLANYAATIGNRGTRMKLTVVDEIRDYSRENVVKPFEPVVEARVSQPPEAFETVIEGLVAASRIGTARATFGDYPIDVASKTGTPETSGLCNSTFICFAPAEDPVVAVAVVIENGWHGYTGAPVARDMLDAYFGFPANPA
jgi:penicillin-binding protein 2